MSTTSIGSEHLHLHLNLHLRHRPVCQAIHRLLWLSGHYSQTTCWPWPHLDQSMSTVLDWLHSVAQQWCQSPVFFGSPFPSTSRRKSPATEQNCALLGLFCFACSCLTVLFGGEFVIATEHSTVSYLFYCHSGPRKVTILALLTKSSAAVVLTQLTRKPFRH